MNYEDGYMETGATGEFFYNLLTNEFTLWWLITWIIIPIICKLYFFFYSLDGIVINFNDKDENKYFLHKQSYSQLIIGAFSFSWFFGVFVGGIVIYTSILALSFIYIILDGIGISKETLNYINEFISVVPLPFIMLGTFMIVFFINLREAFEKIISDIERRHELTELK